MVWTVRALRRRTAVDGGYYSDDERPEHGEGVRDRRVVCEGEAADVFEYIKAVS